MNKRESELLDLLHQYLAEGKKTRGWMTKLANDTGIGYDVIKKIALGLVSDPGTSVTEAILKHAGLYPGQRRRKGR